MSFYSAQHDQIEELAYTLWEKRGSPLGSPDEDWFLAETELSRTQQAEELPLYAISLEAREQ